MKLYTKPKFFYEFMKKRKMDLTQFAKFCHISERQAKGLLDGEVSIGLRKVLGLLADMEVKPNDIFYKIEFTGKREILLRDITMKELYGVDLTKTIDF